MVEVQRHSIGNQLFYSLGGMIEVSEFMTDRDQVIMQGTNKWMYTTGVARFLQTVHLRRPIYIYWDIKPKSLYQVRLMENSEYEMTEKIIVKEDWAVKLKPDRHSMMVQIGLDAYFTGGANKPKQCL